MNSISVCNTYTLCVWYIILPVISTRGADPEWHQGEELWPYATVFVNVAELEPESTLAVLLNWTQASSIAKERRQTAPWHGTLENALMAAAGAHAFSKVKFLFDNGASCEPVGSQTALHFVGTHILPSLARNASKIRVETLVELLEVLIEAGVKKTLPTAKARLLGIMHVRYVGEGRIKAGT